MKTAGIIGGMSWTSSLEYYRLMNRLTNENLGGCHSAKVVLWSVDFSDHLGIHQRGGWNAVAEEAIGIARRLEAAGADFLLLAVNTLHRVAAQVEEAVQLPLLHIVDAVGTEIRQAGISCVGLLGTRHTMNEDFYARRLWTRFGIEVIVPEEADRVEIDRIIFEQLAVERYEVAARNRCLEIIAKLSAAGADGVVLGCTELPLLVPPQSTSTVLFDTLRIHARAAVEYALAD